MKLKSKLIQYKKTVILFFSFILISLVLTYIFRYRTIGGITEKTDLDLYIIEYMEILKSHRNQIDEDCCCYITEALFLVPSPWRNFTRYVFPYPIVQGLRHELLYEYIAIEIFDILTSIRIRRAISFHNFFEPSWWYNRTFQFILSRHNEWENKFIITFFYNEPIILINNNLYRIHRTYLESINRIDYLLTNI